MYKKNLLKLFCLLILAGICTTALAVNESEPNNSWNQADNIALGASGNGNATYSQDNDWWKVTTASDGDLSVQCTPNNGKYTYCTLYDTLGTILISTNSYGASQFSITVPGLRAGTYYIRLYCFYLADSSNYTIVPTLLNAPVANDIEPNDTKATPQTLGLNDSITGHVNYYYNNKRDSADWYKVTTNKDGDISLTLNPVTGVYTWVELYDNNGTTLLESGYSTSQFTITQTGLAKGTYKIRVVTYYNYEYCSYKLKNNLATTVNNDVEPNDIPASAVTVNVNDSLTGHSNYYYNLQRDTLDYYKVTTTSDGDLSVKLYALIGNYVWVDILDNNGTTLLNGIYTTTNITNTVSGLRAGTYYIRIHCYYNYEYSPYAFKVTHAPAAYTNDVEPNDDYLHAETIASPADSTTGHTGYYYNGNRDSTDWYKITTTNDGWLALQISNSTGKYIVCELFDSNGATLLNSANSTTTFTLQTPNLKKGTYYIRVRMYYYYEFGSYALKSTFTTQGNNDSETNEYAKKGTLITGYKTKTGHIGYYGGGSYDVVDWWRIGYFASGNLVITFDQHNHTYDNANYYAYYQLYSDTNASPIDNQLVNADYTHTYNGLVAGTYYIKITQYSSNYGDYSLKANYKDTTSATIKLTTSSAGTAGACNTGSATYFVTRGLTPYSVQLYLDGVAYGVPVTTSDTAKFTALPPGAFYATVKCAGAVTTVTTSTIKGLVAKPKGNNAISITGTQAVVKWTSFTCVDGFIVSYKKTADATFISDTINSATATKDTLKNLALSTSYDYKVASFTNYGGVKYISAFTTVKSFTTLAAKLDNTAMDIETSGMISVFPNPADNITTLDLSALEGSSSVMVYDITGRNVISQSGVSGMIQLDLSLFESGIYTIKVTDQAGNIHRSKIIKQ